MSKVADETRIFPLGDSALTVEFGSVMSFDVNRRATALADYLAADPFEGFIEAVPAYAAATVFYDAVIVSRACSTDESVFDTVRQKVLSAIAAVSEAAPDAGRLVEIPVKFDLAGDFDLGEIAANAGLAPQQVIDIFTAVEYRVFMLGFLPGFAYMGEVDERIAAPRKETPRKLVPAGSVGIAGRQTGVYALASPGGWQVIGRTDLRLFTPAAERPTLLAPGDRVRFAAI